jgi:hypothetical protein
MGSASGTHTWLDVTDNQEDVDDPMEVDPDDDVLTLGPGGIDDPETVWETGASTQPLPPLSPNEFVLLEPGEDPRWADALPKPRHLPLALAARSGELVVCSGHSRTWSRTPSGRSSEHGDAPMAHRIVIVFVQHRARGNPKKPRKYLVVAGRHDELLGWLDYSNTWDLSAQRIQDIARASGLECGIERFADEPEFERAYPGWVG